MLTAIFATVALQTRAKPLSPDLPVLGLHLGAPNTASIPAFTKFIRDALPKEGVNTLVVEFDYRFKFKKHPEIADSDAYSVEQCQEIAQACKDAHVRLIPQINLLGHQSWASNTESLLRAHPEFDETRGKYPHNKGKDNLGNDFYCRSYCPNAPGLHQVIFDSIDELCDACGADAFHCGMDEVFILADPDCPNCKGKTAAEVFAGEVNALHDHLKATGRQMWMWGDRFLDGRKNGLGMWEASQNGSYDAIGHVPRDIMICDWHYEHAEPTPAFFATEGFPVVAAPWHDSGLAVKQLDMMRAIRTGANDKIAKNSQGVLETTWCDTDAFIRVYYGGTDTGRERVARCVKCFKDLFKAVRAAQGPAATEQAAVRVPLAGG